MFNRILIANRGEIACRIIKTAKALGIQTVAIYSLADKNSLHRQEADEAYCVGESVAKDSYLNIERIVQIATEAQVEAVHPGYGFLSENPRFAQACANTGLIFIGPSVFALEVMGSKQAAKQLLEKTKVPMIPGYHGQNQSKQHLLQEAKKMGFPVLLKAANGGGGKGMREVHTEEAFEEAFNGAKRESMASFGDDTMILEKLILHPRHIELQIMADNHGNVVHLFERDCSIQRRHQKIIEEAPAFQLSSQLRQKLAHAAIEVARFIQYRGAGTVEFLVDSAEEFYFMEMNTRLQVEHPVTEMITGLDLVAWQLKIAANEVLPLAQADIYANGHAIECRIYAEDPYHDFLPSIGQISTIQEPQGDHVRIDSGVEQGSAITKYYDPMLAKLITWGETREVAIKRMHQALQAYWIAGIKTNIPFLIALTCNTQFRQAPPYTDFLNTTTLSLPVLEQEVALSLRAAADYLMLIDNIQDPLLQECFAWQAQGRGSWVWRYQKGISTLEVLITPIDNHQFLLQYKEEVQQIQAHWLGQQLHIEVDGSSYRAFIDKQLLHLYTEAGPILLDRFHWEKLDEMSLQQGQLTAPMPSVVVAILKKEGDKVKAGERLMVLEAMKMEHSIYAPNDGIVAEVFYTIGAQVNEGVELLTLR
jgi:3-methylcrotonyl-CoA carboxylase alpha subunit